MEAHAPCSHASQNRKIIYISNHYPVYRLMKSQRTLIHTNLCIALLSAQLLYLIGIERTASSVRGVYFSLVYSCFNVLMILILMQFFNSGVRPVVEEFNFENL